MGTGEIYCIEEYFWVQLDGAEEFIVCGSFVGTVEETIRTEGVVHFALWIRCRQIMEDILPPFGLYEESVKHLQMGGNLGRKWRTANLELGNLQIWYVKIRQQELKQVGNGKKKGKTANTDPTIVTTVAIGK
jgi:hypothetical protein